MPGRPFVKGQSGNPSGRPKSDTQIRDLARKHTPEALQTLVNVATEGKSESARVSAAVALLDRAWGRPMQTIEANFKPRPASELSDAELAVIAAGGGVSGAPPVDPSKLN